MLSRSGSTCHKRLHPTIPSIPTHTNTPMTPKSKLPAPHLLLAMAAPCAATAHCTSEPSTPSNLICIRGRYALRRQALPALLHVQLCRGCISPRAARCSRRRGPGQQPLPRPRLDPCVSFFSLATGSLEDMVVGVT
ncbi:uncharacterized protein [Zea mays]|uniref:uncharacterized protein isoform X1 n=1 Tax=Zea mays TaxID=4577 RepID=UPI000C6C848E|nr:uncharacterized protein LOC100275057 isoform X1 [Zea mays]|eukprot:XP_023156984.1 uncharacterized protein LOC100275057 isoform X1 [Zea mays]